MLPQPKFGCSIHRVQALHYRKINNQMGSQLRAQGGGAPVLLLSVVGVNCEDLMWRIGNASRLLFFVSRADSSLMLALCSDFLPRNDSHNPS